MIVLVTTAAGVSFGYSKAELDLFTRSLGVPPSFIRSTLLASTSLIVELLAFVGTFIITVVCATDSGCATLSCVVIGNGSWDCVQYDVSGTWISMR